MFRNIYIESYKNSIQQSNSLEIMLIHAHHIHSVMGCVLQDIEFMIANALAQMKSINAEDRQAIKKGEGKERYSMPGKLPGTNFKVPDVEFLPSNSFKIDIPKLCRQDEELSNKSIHLDQNRNFDSFEAMFPQPKMNKEYDETSKSFKSAKKNESNQAIIGSQEDFMDFLWKKKK